MEDSKKYKRSFGNSRWGERLRWFVRTPQRSTIVGFSVMLLTYSVIYSVGIRLIYGKEHPINRFTWRQMERRNELSDELIEKKKTLDAYYFDTLNQVRLWKWENDRNVDVFSFSKTNYD